MIEQYGTIIKFGIYLSLVTAVIGFIKWQQDIQYDRGYNTARVEMLDQFRNDLEDATKAKNKQLDDIIANHKAQKAKDAALIKELMKKPKVVYRDIIKTVEVMDCKRLGPDGLELWKRTTSRPDGFSRVGRHGD